MIASLRGTVAAKSAAGCVIDVGGVGYAVALSTRTATSLPEVGAEATLAIHTHVREDALALYGFGSEPERALFEALLGVAGIGPKVALLVCSAFTPEQFRRALVTDDVAGISAVPGIGKKTAQRILLDLKEKLDLPDLALVGSAPDTLALARSALENLGYSTTEVRAALSEIDPASNEDVQTVVRSALKVLAS